MPAKTKIEWADYIDLYPLYVARWRGRCRQSAG